MSVLIDILGDVEYGAVANVWYPLPLYYADYEINSLSILSTGSLIQFSLVMIFGSKKYSIFESLDIGYTKWYLIACIFSK